MSRPVPKTLQLLRGNPGHRPLRENEPELEAGLPPCPAHLDPKAKTLWRRLSADLVSLGAANLDATILERACACYATVRDCEAFLKKNGRSYETRTESGDKMYRVRPEWGMVMEASRELRQLLESLGCSMTSRCKLDTKKLGVAKATKGDLAKFTRKRIS